MKKAVSLLLNAFIAVTVPYAWLKMMFSAGGLLSSSGWGALKYFTVLSNLLMGLASLIYIAALVIGKGVPRRAAVLKHTATTAVALTFMTVMAFLGPVFGYGTMFSGANLWFHLLVPIAAIVDYAFFFENPDSKFSDTFAAIIPMLAYSAFYLANILINGKGEWPDTNDWYGFLSWGAIPGLGIFAAMLLATWGMAAGLRALNRKSG